MSTRCQIGIYESPETDLNTPFAVLYNHSDGYPDGEYGILSVLKPLLKDFSERRGLEDTEYLSAWVLYALMERTVLSNQAYHKKYQKRKITDSLSDYYRKDGRSFIGFGICGDKGIHGDIEYFYRIDPSGIKVYEDPPFPANKDYDAWHAVKSDLKNWTLKEEIIVNQPKPEETQGPTIYQQPKLSL